MTDDGLPHFVTVDDLDSKAWFGHVRETVFDGLRRALNTAAALRHMADRKAIGKVLIDVTG